MQGDPREIKTAGLITGGAARDEFIFTAVSKVQVKEKHHIIDSADHFAKEKKKKRRKKKDFSVCFSVCGSDTKRGSCD